MFSTIRPKTRLVGPVLVPVLLSVGLVLCVGAADRPDETELQVGFARVKITPEAPIRMAGYASRNKPSEGVLADLYAKAMAIADGRGERAVLITADVIGFNAAVADAICGRIMEKTTLQRRQILLNASHTHTGPVIGLPGATSYGLEGEAAARVHRYGLKLAGQLADLAVAALADLRPSKVSWGVGWADFVMNRREFTDRGVRLGFNPRGYVDRSVPVMRVDSPDGKLRGLMFGCACHNTTLTGKHYQLSADYAGFAQAYIEERLPGVQAMFMAGCGGSANPHPRGTVEAVEQHGRSLGAEVCRVAAEALSPVRGPLRVELKLVDLPLAPVPPREQLEEMIEGPSYIAFNARKMLAALDKNESLPTEYAAPFAVWQFGGDLTLVALPGEVVNEYVPLLESVLGHRKLWIAAYANDCFGYLPTARVLAEGGYETRCLYTATGFFAPEVEGVVLAEVRQMAEKVGRSLLD
ncbi:MAG: neutral/alkaline non-lysosomal ceramidase N-terminal domain-containing protein [Planctomycetes bacterium]|nr:neutral/alkaline non-lysosomal ceramidase N-terminal domain-containing protein [Planctomycetota bacterium]